MKRQVWLEFRRRTRPSDDILKLHRHLLEQLRTLESPWWNPEADVDTPNLDQGLEAQVNLGSGLPKNIRGYVSYVFRDPSYSHDSAEFDDRLYLDASVDQAEYELMVTRLFPALVDAFRPYRAGVAIDEDLALDDWDRAIEISQASGKDADGRDGVLRIPPVCFFDDELCHRAFGDRPKKLVRCLREGGFDATVINDGLLLLASRKLIDREDLIALDSQIRAMITNPDGTGSKSDDSDDHRQ